MSREIWPLIIADAEAAMMPPSLVDRMHARAAKGLATYGVPFTAATYPPERALSEALDEVLDALAYLRGALEGRRARVGGRFDLLCYAVERMCRALLLLAAEIEHRQRLA